MARYWGVLLLGLVLLIASAVVAVRVVRSQREAEAAARPIPPVADMDTPMLAEWAARGEKFWRIKGCNACHSVDGTRNIGPSAMGVWGTKQKLADGNEVLVDEDYIRESVFDPATKMTAGYPNQMQSYLGRVTEDEMKCIAAYYRSLAAPAAAPEQRVR